MKKNLPELLAPAGSPEALNAAVAAGADAVYFGAASFNARMNAKNFSGDTLKRAIELCKDSGVKTNITVNTLVHTREMSELLKTVEELYRLGADALIIADLGAASLVRKYFPDLELHASTQAAGHNHLAAVELQRLGFARMVAARELSMTDIRTLCATSPIETEIFVHGAICVSQSGQCLASSMIGKRSGNRGECAQPCRLSYKNESGRESSALSLKDMCLAEHIPEILDLGVASLKIEGRMKAPDYVYGVTSIYRRLIDEARPADKTELDELRGLFSRSGFTDGYFTNNIGKKMLGVRTDSDKSATKSLRAVPKPPIDYKRLISLRIEQNRKDALLPIEMLAKIKESSPISLTLKCGSHSATALGQLPEKANNRPLTAEAVSEKLTKLGATRFFPDKVDIDLDQGLMLPLSALNQLRRDAVEALEKQLEEPSPERKTIVLPTSIPTPPRPNFKQLNTARIEFPDRTELPSDHPFDIVFVPLEKYTPDMKGINGIIVPPVVFDSELPELQKMLESAKSAGIDHALVSNIGHIAPVKAVGMHLHGDFRLNIFNKWSADILLSLGFEDLIASPELTIPRLRDLSLPIIAYGRIPLMTLQKCCIRDLYSCKLCEERGFLPLIDRMNAVFPLTRAWQHRNILYNSVPVYMADRQGDLPPLGQHFIFTDERIENVLSAYKNNIPPQTQVRRISK